MESCTLWMGAIQPSWSENFLKNIFLEELNEKVSVKLFKNNLGPYDSYAHTPSPRRVTPIGYAFIEFRSHEIAKKAKEQLQNKTIKDTNVLFRLNWAMRDKKKLTQKQEQCEHSLFVGDLADEVTDEVLYQVFRERFLSITAAHVVIDPTTGHSKKYGFVRFNEIEEYIKAIETMSGVVIGSRAIRVGHATAKHAKEISPLPDASQFFGTPDLRSLAQLNATDFVDLNQGADYERHCTVFVGNLDSKVTESELRQHFEDCGEITSVNIPQFKKGCGFIKFSKPEEAKRAIETKKTTRLGESKIRLDLGRKRKSSGATMGASNVGNYFNFNQQPQQFNMLNMPDLSALKYVGNFNNLQGVTSVSTPTYAYNYNYVGMISKPAPPYFYNFNAQQHTAQNISLSQATNQALFSQKGPMVPNQGTGKNSLQDLSMGMQGLHLSNTNTTTQQHQTLQQQPGLNEPAALRKSNDENTRTQANSFGFNSYNFNVQ